MALRSLLLTLYIFLHTSYGFAQYFPEKQYPQNYFSWPVNAKIGLAANFGELRPNHYHMGLDCRTDQTQNRPVLAAADGYVAKIKIEPFGFGRCLYINHPNGYTTLYAHLNDFNPAIEKYITEQQYLLQSWAVFIDVPAGLLKVHKGEMIASSGNTGGSQGPHLHFEIRETQTDIVLNPLLFGFPLEDNIAPDILRLAVYDRRISTYEQTPKIYSLKKVNGIYTVAGGKVLTNSNEVSFAITAYDRYTGSTNQNGIYEAVLYENELPVSGFQIDHISYDETRYLNGHIDYKTRSNGGPWLQHLSKLPGYNNSIYKTNSSQGVVILDTGVAKQISIKVKDAKGNKSELAFSIEARNVQAVPQSINTLPYLFKPGCINIFENSEVEFYLPENALYDFVHFKYAKLAGATGNPIYQLLSAQIPLQTNFPLKIKGNFSLADSSRIVMERVYGSKKDYKKAVFESGWYKSSFREFGNFQLLIDNIPPVVTSRGLINNMNAARLGSIIFTVTDDTEELNSFTALLDGKWLRFSNDKGRNFVYRFDERCGPGPHELKIRAEDQVGNVTERVYNFTR
jgi:murein DD-endopeptidase MepM/ murein hydrolase activator NlpD